MKKQIFFPVGGLHENAGYDLQPPATTSGPMVNVRPHDSLKGRGRGGRRPGSAKWFASQINGDEPIQAMVRAVRAIDYPPSGFDSVFVARTHVSGTADAHHISSAGATVLAQGWPGTVRATTRPAANDATFICSTDQAFIGFDANAVNNVFKVDPTVSIAAGDIVWGFRGADEDLFLDETNDRVYCCGQRNNTWDTSAGAQACVWALDSGTGAVLWSRDLTVDCVSLDYDVTNDRLYVFGQGTGGSNNNVFKLNGTTGATIQTFKTGGSINRNNTIRVREGGDRIIVVSSIPTTNWTGTDSTSKNVFILDNSFTLLQTLLIDLAPAVTTRTDQAEWVSAASTDFIFTFSHLTTAANSRVRRYTNGGVQEWSFTSGSQNTRAVSGTKRRVFVVGAENTGWTGASGTAADFWVLDNQTGAVTTHVNNADSSTVGPNKLTLRRGPVTTPTTRESSLVVAAGGLLYKILDDTKSAATGSYTLTVLPQQIVMVPLYSKVFIVDGTNFIYYDLNTGAAADFVASDGVAPDGCRLACRYRGRLVLSGSVNDPHNWFMSAVGDPFDFDYAPAVSTAKQAVAGNNSEAGLIGDIVTALIPYSDDLLIFGCDGQIWSMTGDPAAGGSIDLVSDDTGITWGSPYCKDPTGALYFMAPDGIYKMLPGSKPVSITDSKLAERFSTLDFTIYRAELEWDNRRYGMMFTFTPDPESDSEYLSYFYDLRADAWMVDEWPTNYGPTVLYAFDSDKAEDQAMLLGCFDGYIREIVTDAEDDDGTDIESVVRCAPIQLDADDTLDSIIEEIVAVLADTSGSIELRVYMGQTAEQCQLATVPRYTRMLTRGRNACCKNRVRGAWIQVELAQSEGTRWALESLKVAARKSGKARRQR